MDIIIIISLLFAFASVILGFILEGGTVTALLQLTAAIIVFGGTIGAVGISFPGDVLKKFPKVASIAFKKRENKIQENINYFKYVSTKTRKEGLLTLEAELSTSQIDPFIKKGLQMVVDGTEQSIVESILETKLEQISERHEAGIELFTAAGGYAPTMGIIGTVMGLVQVVGNLSNPTELGPKIASAFMATLYGIATANILWLPIANKLKMLNRQEINEKQMIIEAILLIQQGSNPNTLVSKLEGFLTEDQAKVFEKDQ
ncbi:flagellar motor protein [Clostridium uliginosum]|uniref:Chemotaxis protein MotA n=1 Tax=Clostridium uliginosum TaxID=119641 RepID=A0A1I1SQ16_9CLOT|nr:flagellar motor protein [Clostridium uliginosum]SFD45140.1 chemotaxis protein MotA [Clostridium uliginosum]